MDCVPVQEELLMHRFFADPLRSTESEVCLTAEDARHAVTVLRLKPGQRIEIIRDALLWEAEITSAVLPDVRAVILSELPSAEPSLAVTLYQGIPKSDKMDLIVQKATELGVSRIVPVIMSRCVAKPDRKDISHKLDRWQKIIREAAKQSGRCVIPIISEPVSLRQLGEQQLPECCIVPWEEASGFGPRAFSLSHPSIRSLGILIGPEGGIENDEITFLRSLGFIPVTLGKRILRTETAGMAAVSAFMSLYGEMD